MFRSLYGLTIVVLVAVLSSARTTSAWPIHGSMMPMNPDGWQAHLQSSIESQTTPKPEPLAVIAHAVRSGGRIRIVVEGRKAYDHSKPWDDTAVLTNVPSGFAEAIEKLRQQLQQRIIERTAFKAFVSVATFAVFADKESIGIPEKLIGYELQLRLPLLVRDATARLGIKDGQYFFGTNGIPHPLKPGDCLDFLQTLI